jgi:hypothetical protein
VDEKTKRLIEQMKKDARYDAWERGEILERSRD